MVLLMNVMLAAIAKDECQYLPEWIAFHKLLGFNKIVIYDNESTDGSRAYLQQLAKNSIIEYRFWQTKEGISPQLSAYNDCINDNKDMDFIAFFDLDEFLVVKNGQDFMSFLDSVPEDVSAIAVNQRLFGSAGLVENSSELVIERFTKCCHANYDEMKWFKSIVKPKRVSKYTSSHAAELINGKYVHTDFSELIREPGLKGKAQDIQTSQLQLNHYILKSKQEFFEKKQRRGGVVANTKKVRMARHKDGYFYNRDKWINKEAETFSDEFLVKLKSQISELGQITNLDGDM